MQERQSILFEEISDSEGSGIVIVPRKLGHFASRSGRKKIIVTLNIRLIWFKSENNVFKAVPRRRQHIHPELLPDGDTKLKFSHHTPPPSDLITITEAFIVGQNSAGGERPGTIILHGHLNRSKEENFVDIDERFRFSYRI